MKTPLVSLRRVSVSYDGHDALKEVDLDIYPDDFLGIIGPNGGGKTTLVKAIVGTIPYRGTISYSPQLFRGKERLIGYMPQQSIFDRSFPISVLEVVMSGRSGAKGFPCPLCVRGSSEGTGAAADGRYRRDRPQTYRRDFRRSDAAGVIVSGGDFGS